MFLFAYGEHVARSSAAGRTGCTIRRGRSTDEVNVNRYTRFERRSCDLPLWPEDALIAGDHVADALVNEFLDALTLPGLGRVDVTLGVGRDRVHAVELAGLAAAVAERGDLFERLAQDDPHAVVHAVGEIDETLLRIARERDVPGRARAERGLGVERLLHEFSVRLEHLQPIIGA